MRIRKRKDPEGERFGARISRERKSRWQQAATLRGDTLTEFVVTSVDAAAERTIKEADFMDLTQRDRLAFVKALLNAPQSPNAKLREAVERHTELFSG